MKMNVNEYVWVKLTEDGMKHLAKKGSFSLRDEDNGFHKFQMWDFMAIFGDGMVLGGRVLFDGGYIHFTKPV